MTRQPIFDFRAFLRNLLAYVVAVIIIAILCFGACAAILVARAEHNLSVQRAAQAEVRR